MPVDNQLATVENQESASLIRANPLILEAKKSGRTNPAWVTAFVFIIALLGLLGFSLLNKGGSGYVKTPFIEPPPFNLKLFKDYSFEGKSRISPALVKGRPLVINFWASWCIPCRDEAPVLEKLSREYSARYGVVFLGIAFQDREEDSLAFLKRYGVNYANGPDTSGEISIDYGVTGIPETYFITAEGQVQRKYIRALTAPVMRGFLDELVQAK